MKDALKEDCFLIPNNSVGYKNSEDRISEMDKLECYRLGWVGLVKVLNGVTY